MKRRAERRELRKMQFLILKLGRLQEEQRKSVEFSSLKAKQLTKSPSFENSSEVATVKKGWEVKSVDGKQGCSGDFNVVKEANESSREDSTLLGVTDFQNVLAVTGLSDHSWIGNYYTWSNKRIQDFLARKRDRVLINENWTDFFSESTVEFLNPLISDHCPSVVRVVADVTQGRKSFKIFNYWTEHEEYQAKAKTSWSQNVIGNPMYRLRNKLKILKGILKDFNRLHYSDISGRVAEAQEGLEEVQAQQRDVWSAGLTKGSRVSAIIEEDRWIWRRRRSPELVAIQEGFQHIRPCSSLEHKITWLAHPKGNFTVACTWEHIRDKGPPVDWILGLKNIQRRICAVQCKKLMDAWEIEL
ncbi:hypothetical protein CRG98_031124 [Punica granatum]|uniref:Endonuclease/exonuclease/phosphatase domain-containing protein n=1 Tax=Punica granatum TaxID=22663 RepID=A0A2I0IWV8_PUNGR|nr:hypothetical protein CRG98_031124 [Punica granatum]